MKEQYYELIKLYDDLSKPLSIGLECIRQNYLKENYYRSYIKSHRSNLKDNILEPFQKEEPEHIFPFWVFQENYLELMIIHYTRGIEISALIPMLTYLEKACTVYNHESHRETVKKFSVESLTMDELILTNISLWAIFKRSKHVQFFLNGLKPMDRDDKLVTHLIHYYLDPSIAPSVKPYNSMASRNKDFLIKAIVAETEQDTLENLNKYLTNWYRVKANNLNRYHDSHTSKNLFGMDYFGYWSFEAALVAIEKNIDDSSLHQYLYYPKDLVEYVRNNPVQDQ